MDIKCAASINLADYTWQPLFEDVCRYSELIDLCTGPEFKHTDKNGTDYSSAALVRQAEYANATQKGLKDIATHEFILSYLNFGFIPFENFDKAANILARKYNSSHKVAIDERTAMAAVLMNTIGHEQRKLCILRRAVNAHNTTVLGAQTQESPLWQISRAENYAKYHIDMVEVSQTGHAILQGYQFERKEAYFDILEFRKDAQKLSKQRRVDIDQNRKQLNLFLTDYPSARITLACYKAKQSGGSQITSQGLYTSVKPICE